MKSYICSGGLEGGYVNVETSAPLPVILCILILLEFFIYQLMHKSVDLKRML
jgi:hypothetical protein